MEDNQKDNDVLLKAEITMGRKPLLSIGDGGITLDSLRVSRHISDKLESTALAVSLTVPELRRHILDRFFADLGNLPESMDYVRQLIEVHK